MPLPTHHNNNLVSREKNNVETVTEFMKLMDYIKTQKATPNYM